MKLNWGVRIAILYGGFVALILTLVGLCMNQKVELVSKDYYEQELKYQERIDAMNNLNTLKSSVDHHVGAEGVNIILPAEVLDPALTGEITFFCPSDSQKDKKFSLAPDAGGKVYIPSQQLQKGTYKMMLSFNSKGKSYYKEDVISIK